MIQRALSPEPNQHIHEPLLAHNQPNLLLSITHYYLLPWLNLFLNQVNEMFL